jgi:hypothetical protein
MSLAEEAEIAGRETVRTSKEESPKTALAKWERFKIEYNQGIRDRAKLMSPKGESLVDHIYDITKRFDNITSRAMTYTFQ